jgi:hypothetical protein
MRFQEMPAWTPLRNQSRAISRTQVIGLSAWLTWNHFLDLRMPAVWDLEDKLIRQYPGRAK